MCGVGQKPRRERRQLGCKNAGFPLVIFAVHEQPIWDIGDRGEEEQEQRDMDLRLGNWDVAEGEGDVPDPSAGRRKDGGDGIDADQKP
jgi:hypothetical protein